MNTKTEMKHTPMPWVVKVINEQVFIDSHKKLVLHGAPCASMSNEENLANADFIVRAVNAHDALVKTMLELRDRLQMGQDVSGNSSINQDEIDLINNALQKAEGK